MCKVSTIIVWNDEQKLSEAVAYLQKQTMFDDSEIISLDNRGSIFPSAAKALNYGASIAKGTVLIFMHQDVYLYDNQTLEKYYRYLSEHENMIAGIAGVCTEDKRVHSDIVETKEKIRRVLPADGRLLPVITLDECMFAMHRSLWEKLRFDETVCRDWHLYAAEICYNNLLSGGGGNILLPVYACHESLGKTNKSYNETLKLLIKKYTHKLSYINTSCSSLPCSLTGFYWYRINRCIRMKLGPFYHKIVPRKGEKK